jgi:hypothetical protein
MHPPARDESLALDPAEDLATLFVHAEPAWRGVEARALQPEEDIPCEPWTGRTVDGVPDADDAVVRRAAGERGLAVSRG